MPFARLTSALAIACGLAAPLPAQEITAQSPTPEFAGRPMEGTVFRDENVNGVRDVGEAGWPGIGVSNSVGIAVTDSEGRYRLEPSEGAMELVFVIQPADCRLTPEMFRAVREIGDFGSVDFGLVPMEVEPGPLVFSQVSDVHVGKREDYDRFLDALREVDNHPVASEFIVATGDLVNRGGTGEQLATYAEVAAESQRPWMHVFGNHDSDTLSEGTRVYRHHLGPDYYSFDRGDVHFIVRNSIFPSETQEAWIREDLQLFGEGKTIVVLQHYPPTTEERHAELHAHGARAVVSGHWHSTRLTEHEGMLSINSPTFMMGAIDVSPAGFRLIRIDGDVINTRFIPGRTGRVLAIQAPAETLQMRAPLDEIWVALHDSEGDVASASHRIEGPETRAGGLRQTSPLGWWADFEPLTTPGEYTATVDVVDLRGQAWSREQRFTLEPPIVEEEMRTSSWPMFMGGPQHTGATGFAFETPLRFAWITTIRGASIDFGSPVTDGERVYVALRDRDNLFRNGVAALSPHSGETLWFTETRNAVCHSLATDGQRVYASEQSGRVLALDAATGDIAWEQTLGNDFERWIYSAPCLVEGHLICGSSKHLACFDPETGEEHWAISPGGEFISSYSSPAVAQGLVVMGGVWQSYGGERRHSLAAFDLETGEQRWAAHSVGFHASPLIVSDEVITMDIDGIFRVHDLQTGEVKHEAEIGGGWSTTTPAHHAPSGTVVTATASSEVIAFDLATRAERWRHRVGESQFRMSSYAPTFRSVFGSPTIAGETVFLGSSNGHLLALDVNTGEELWHHSLGVPTLATPCPTGDLLITAALDGHVIGLRGGSR